MSGNGGYNYGENDHSYGYDYSAQTQGNNYNYGGYNYESNEMNNAPAFSSPYAQPQTTSMNQQPAQQQQPYNPAEALLNNPAAQIGMQFGTQAISAGQEYVNNNVGMRLSHNYGGLLYFVA